MFHQVALSNNELYNPNYDLLSVEKKQEVLSALGEKYGFTLITFKNFERFGKSSYSAIYQKDGAEFVFVPGAEVTPGWDGFKDEKGNLIQDKLNIKKILNQEMLEDLAYAYMELYDDYGDVELEEDEDEEEDDDAYEARIALQIQRKLNDKNFYVEVEKLLKEGTSAIETMVIKPMFVETSYQQCCWKEIPIEQALHNKRWKELIEELRSGKSSSISAYEEVKFVKTEEGSKVNILKNILSISDKYQGIKAYRYQKMTYLELMSQLAETIYRLPTFREWEYFSSKGGDTLFPWGNSIDYSMKLRHFSDYDSDDYSLDEPNFFGLIIGADPYESEITFDGRFRLKGGDGGCNVCGGLGIAMGYFPTSSFYLDKENEIDENAYINGNYEFYRKVLEVDL